ncbi:PREDICTED: BTB/POZ domain-containing [Prunus dulcis]|uniref:PREDICTED: BTB/POZ domain-containing n=1 Tax=Prunus dulcis TaxID=3755 RepID=A0A5E4F2P3_PRUDU|nr:PREDICTED: BTB/POZ domain-containing [Prunus dulcis]
MAGENALKSREVSAMIKQGFISDQTLSFSPSRSISKLYSPTSSPSKTLSSPPHHLNLPESVPNALRDDVR